MAWNLRILREPSTSNVCNYLIVFFKLVNEIGGKMREFLCVLIFGGLMFYAFASRATTLTVTNLNDSGSGTLRQTIASAHSGDTIVFKEGLEGTIYLDSQLEIYKSLTISGESGFKFKPLITLDGQGKCRVLNIGLSNANNGRENAKNIDKINVTLSNLYLTNGYIEGYDGGAGIFSRAICNLTINYCKITKCRYVGFSPGYHLDGAGIVSKGNLTVKHCYIQYNSATHGCGGGISSEGNVEITDSNISHNKAWNGGGIVLKFRSAYLSNTVISYNASLATRSAGYDNTGGGGVYRIGYGDAYEMELTNCTISYNTSKFNGGGIINLGGKFFLNKSNEIIYNSAERNGGGISSVNFCGFLSKLNLSGENHFYCNQAGSDKVSGKGGAIYVDKSTFATDNKSKFNRNVPDDIYYHDSQLKSL